VLVLVFVLVVVVIVAVRHEVGLSTHCDGFASSSSLHLIGGGTATHTRMLWFGSGDGTFTLFKYISYRRSPGFMP